MSFLCSVCRSFSELCVVSGASSNGSRQHLNPKHRDRRSRPWSRAWTEAAQEETRERMEDELGFGTGRCESGGRVWNPAERRGSCRAWEGVGLLEGGVLRGILNSQQYPLSPTLPIKLRAGRGCKPGHGVKMLLCNRG